MSIPASHNLLYLVNEASIADNSSLIRDFQVLYEKGFPDANEREDYEVILKRVVDKPAGFDPYTFIILATDEDSKTVYGGIIADWYEHCRSIHLTYIVVDPDARKKQVGRTLMETGLSEIKNIIKERYGVELKHIFFESNIPWKTSLDSFDPATRLRIFSHMGSKWIDIDYIQPALDTTKERVSNLFLLTYPGTGNLIENVEVGYIIDFLYDLYKGLGVEDPEKDADFRQMADDLLAREDRICVLKEIPVRETPQYEFRKGSVAFHFIEESVPEGATAEKGFCRHFHSYETDLLNFRYQKETPFSTHLLSRAENNEITLDFPELYSFTSEGRIETRYSERTRVKANLSLSYTHFREAGIRIWHITILPGQDGYFTEFDFIKLVTFFGSIQENCLIRDQIRFILKNGKSLLPGELISEISGEKTGKLIFGGTGLVEIDSAQITSGGDEPGFIWDNFYNYLVLTTNRGNSFVRIEKKVDINEALFGFLKITCGIILGIFDFERMGIEEIEDTVNPIEASDSYYSVLNRGELLCIGHEEEMLSSVYDSIGINPYLLIPSSVLCYNEFISSKVIELLDQTLDEVNRTGKTDLSELTEVRRKVEHMLNNLPLEKVFHYPTEKLIYETGISQRQFDSREITIRQKIKELTDIIQTKTAYVDTRAKAMISLVLMVFSCVGLYTRFEAFLKNPVITWIALIVFSIPVTMFVYRKSVSQK